MFPKTFAKAASLLCTAAILMPLTMGAAQAGEPAASLLTPDNHVLMLVDHQPQMAFATHSIDIALLRNNVTGLAKTADLFEVPTILTTVAAESFAGPVFPELSAVFPDQPLLDRTTMNAWEDDAVVAAVEETGRKRIVVAALWSEICGVMPVLSAIEDGYEVYFVTDASGGVSAEAHEMAIERMVEAGATPITWSQYLHELQRDWARSETYAGVTGIAQEHLGGYGLGIFYAHEMFDAQEGATQ